MGERVKLSKQQQQWRRRQRRRESLKQFHARRRQIIMFCIFNNKKSLLIKTVLLLARARTPFSGCLQHLHFGFIIRSSPIWRESFSPSHTHA